MNKHIRLRQSFTSSLPGLALALAILTAGANPSRAAEPTLQTNTRGGVVTSDAPPTGPTTTTSRRMKTVPASDGKTAKETIVEEKPEGLRIHGLVNLQFSDHYFTPRGLDVENQGVIFQPLVLLFWGLYHNDNAFLNDVTLTTGVWNSIHSRQSGPDHDNWNEIDPIFDISFGFAKDFKLEVNYTIFRSQNGSFDTSQNLEIKIDYDDSKLLGAFALHPYGGIWIELYNKATFATTPESFYGEIGMDPSYSFTAFPSPSYPLKIELPSYITFPAKNFYGRSSVVGVIASGPKLSMPLSFIPKSYGAWSIYGQYTFYSLQNPALIKNGDFARSGKPNHSENVLATGLTCVF
jgi:hypothetical protein